VFARGLIILWKFSSEREIAELLTDSFGKETVFCEDKKNAELISFFVEWTELKTHQKKFE